MDTSVVKVETFPLLYLVCPYINQELAIKPRISILTNQNLNIFHPKEKSCVLMQQQARANRHFAMDPVLLQRFPFTTGRENRKESAIKPPCCSPVLRLSTQTTCQLCIIWRSLYIYIFIKSTTAPIFQLYQPPLQLYETISHRPCSRRFHRSLKSLRGAVASQDRC